MPVTAHHYHVLWHRTRTCCTPSKGLEGCTHASWHCGAGKGLVPPRCTVQQQEKQQTNKQAKGEATNQQQTRQLRTGVWWSAEAHGVEGSASAGPAAGRWDGGNALEGLAAAVFHSVRLIQYNPPPLDASNCTPTTKEQHTHGRTLGSRPWWPWMGNRAELLGQTPGKYSQQF